MNEGQFITREKHVYTVFLKLFLFSKFFRYESLFWGSRKFTGFILRLTPTTNSHAFIITLDMSELLVIINDIVVFLIKFIALIKHGTIFD